MLYCSKCKGKAASVFPSFKLQLRVQDSTGTTSFVLFDREVVKLIHKHAYEIREKQEREGDLERFPDDFNDLLNKNFLFKIDVSKYNIDHGYQVYTVMKVCDDSGVISDFMDMYPDDQDDDQGGNGYAVKNDDNVDGCIDKKDVVSSSDHSSIACVGDVDTATTPSVKRSHQHVDPDGSGDMHSAKKMFRFVQVFLVLSCVGTCLLCFVLLVFLCLSLLFPFQTL